jgi:hypothetical protein
MVPSDADARDPAAIRGGDRPAPRRTVHHGDALAWLRTVTPLRGASVITSLPDLSELPDLDVPSWRSWFVGAAAATMQAVGDDGVAIFFQSDVRRAGVWIDKGQMVAEAAQQVGLAPLFHKIVCRKPAGTVTFGRSSYSHLLGFARAIRATAASNTADVLPDAGFRPGTKAMGVAACLDACRFVMRATTCHTIVDPFCGFGTVLAVANALGLDAIGADLSSRMCRRARSLQIDISVPGGAALPAPGDRRGALP